MNCLAVLAHRHADAHQPASMIATSKAKIPSCLVFVSSSTPFPAALQEQVRKATCTARGLSSEDAL
eukprot:15493608-Heterocapsa_arctica.AAC.1